MYIIYALYIYYVYYNYDRLLIVDNYNYTTKFCYGHNVTESNELEVMTYFSSGSGSNNGNIGHCKRN